jgi:hypothetical protein
MNMATSPSKVGDFPSPFSANAVGGNHSDVRVLELYRHVQDQALITSNKVNVEELTLMEMLNAFD